uniref:Uncharacterized protein n=1 Tax=Oryza brachyantha TaxID=4533 RepID=J3MCX0_ORYBR
IDCKFTGLQTDDNWSSNSAQRDQKQGTMGEALAPPSAPTTLLSFACWSPPAGGESLARFIFFLASSSSSAAYMSSRCCACSMAVASPGTVCFISSAASAPWLPSSATICRTSCLDRAAR